MEWAVTRRMITNGTLKYSRNVFFGKFDPLMENFLEYETMCHEPSSGHVFVGSLAEIDPRKVAEVVHHWPDKKHLCDPFFALSLRPIVRFYWKHARLSLFRPQPHLQSFIQIDPSFQDLLARTTFQIVTIIGNLISIGSSTKTGNFST